MNRENLQIGKKYQIHGYKHNGKIRGCWDEAVLLEIHDDYLVFANNSTKVTEADGRVWYTKEPAVLYFFDNNWYNVIGQYKKRGIYYYCNMASPYIIEEDTIKYIDYDLDLRVFPDGGFKILDRGEYRHNKEEMNYPRKIDSILKSELTDLINMVKKKQLIFDNNMVEYYCKKYIELTKNSVNANNF